MAENRGRAWEPRNRVKVCALRPTEENLEKKEQCLGQHRVLDGLWEVTGEELSFGLLQFPMETEQDLRTL